MRRTDLSLYEKRLRKSVSGFRRRSKVQAAFRRSLSPLLEETPCPSYDALLRAFGPPEHMAQTLLQTMTASPERQVKMDSCCQYPSASYFRVLRCVVLPRSSRTKFHTVRCFRLFRESLTPRLCFLSGSYIL